MQLQRCNSTVVRSTRPLLAAAGVILLLTVPRIGVRFNLTASMPRGFYLEVAGDPRVGDVVEACPGAPAARFALDRGYLGAGACPGGVEPLVKLVAAVGPASLEGSLDGVTVDGRPLEGSRPLFFDSLGRQLRPFLAGAVSLRAGEVWLHSSHPRSWDSRYFGPVDDGAIVSVVRPLLTE